MAELTIGQVVDGRYELEAVIGKGGMGCVFRAKHVITHGRVALKVLTDTVDAELQQRFLAEARAASTIGHPAIVAVSDAGRTADGQLYLVMELLAGKPLRAAMQGGLPADQIRRIGLELLDALGAAHSRGIIHRDLKPENILVVAATGALKILDFGIAKVMGAGSITATGYMLGTLEYMAPEQLADAARIDARADLWSVGVILYELIAGVRPLGGTTREEKYTALATDEPMPIGDVVPVSPEVSTFFAQALARDPARRFQTTHQMAAALRSLALVSHAASGAPPPGSGTLATGGAWAPGGPTMGTARPMGPPPIQPARSSSAGKRVALPIALVAVAGAIAFGIVMASKQDAAWPPADAVVQAEPPKPVDAAIVPVVIDATVTVDVPVVIDAPVAELVAPGQRGSCEDHCKRLEKCALRQPSCVDDCKTYKTDHLCLDNAVGCPALAACYWKRFCGGKPVRNGDMPCVEAGACFEQHRNLGNSTICGQCVDRFTPTTALLFAKHRICSDNADYEAEQALIQKRPLAGNPGSRCDALFMECGKDLR